MLKIYNTVAAQLASLRKDEKGVTALEYGVIASVVIVVGLAGFGAIGPVLNALWAPIVALL